MNNFVKNVYVSEVVSQATYALRAAKDINAWMASSKDQSQKVDVHVLFGYLHTFLTHASNVSKIFWPMLPKKGKNESDEKYKARVPALERSVELRALFSIIPDGALESRDLRNHLEHYDERLDEWAEECSTIGQFSIVNFVVGPPTTVSGNAIDRKSIMRHFDPSTAHFIFRGESYDVGAISDAINDIIKTGRDIQKQLQ